MIAALLRVHVGPKPTGIHLAPKSDLESVRYKQAHRFKRGHRLLNPIGGEMRLICSRGVFVCFALSLAAGCSSTEGMHNARADDNVSHAEESVIKIDSEPSGADVFAMGQKIGTTPLTVNTKEVFPRTYPKEKESLYGKLTFKKEGCSDLTRSVSPKLIVLRGQLDCGTPKPVAQESSKGTSEVSVAPATQESSKGASGANATVEQRLTKIKDLLDKGLITEEEAKKARERVLNDL